VHFKSVLRKISTFAIKLYFLAMALLIPVVGVGASAQVQGTNPAPAVPHRPQMQAQASVSGPLSMDTPTARRSRQQHKRSGRLSQKAWDSRRIGEW
jgi:hypothetical protein